MPILQLTLSESLPRDKEAALAMALTKKIKEIKPEVQEIGIMVSFVQGNVYYGGEGEAPAAHGCLNNAKMSPEITSALTKGITKLVCDATGVNPMRFYLEFWTFPSDSMLAIGGQTFTEMRAAAEKAAEESGK